MTIFSKLFDGVPVTFESGLAQDVALKRLDQLTRWGPDKVDILGEVKAEQVKLYLAGHRGQPGAEFTGRFNAGPTGMVLRGRFAADRGDRVFCGIVVSFFGFLLIGIFLGEVWQMILEYQSLADLLMRFGQLLLEMAAIAIFASLFAFLGSPRNKHVAKLSLAISRALRDDAQIARDEAAKEATKKRQKK